MRTTHSKTEHPSFPDERDTLDSRSGSRSGSCSAIIGSMTQAMAAQTALAEAAIRSSIIKVSASRSHGGCAYGVEFPCTQSANVRLILNRAGVRVREYTN